MPRYLLPHIIWFIYCHLFTFCRLFANPTSRVTALLFRYEQSRIWWWLLCLSIYLPTIPTKSSTSPPLSRSLSFNFQSEFSWVEIQQVFPVVLDSWELRVTYHQSILYTVHKDHFRSTSQHVSQIKNQTLKVIIDLENIYQIYVLLKHQYVKMSPRW